HCRTLFTDNSRPNATASARFVAGEEKWTLLGSAKTLINVHQGVTPYFEWQRVLGAILNGCVVVSEHSAEATPLEPGRHFVSGRPETLALLVEELLEDEARRPVMRHEAYEVCRDAAK